MHLLILIYLDYTGYKTEATATENDEFGLWSSKMIATILVR